MSWALGPNSPLSGMINRASPGPSSGVDQSKAVPVPRPAVQSVQSQAKPGVVDAVALWPEQTDMTLRVYVSTSDDPYASAQRDSYLLQHTFEPVKYGDWKWPEQTWSTTFDVPQVSLPL